MLKTLVAVALFIQMVYATRNYGHQQQGSPVRQCSDGFFCKCRNLLKDDEYSEGKATWECQTQLGVPHAFSRGSYRHPSRQTCLTFSPGNIRRHDVIICVAKKFDLIVNINGVYQWDLDRLRINIIKAYHAKYSAPHQEWIRQILEIAILVCPHNPKDLQNFPFIECESRALSLINSSQQNRGVSISSLSLEPLSDTIERSKGNETEAEMKNHLVSLSDVLTPAEHPGEE